MANGQDPGMVSYFQIRADERTFKSLGERILHMEVLTDAQRIRRAALINSAKTFVDSRIRAGDSEYRPLEYYMTGKERLRRRRPVNIDITRIKLWLQHNLDVFEKKASGRIDY